MTIFNRVFQKHLESQGKSASDHEWMPEPDACEFQTVLDVKNEAVPDPAESDDGLPDVLARLRESPADASPEPKPELVARAAEAHKLLTQRGTAQPSDNQAQDLNLAAEESPEKPAPKGNRTRILGFGEGAPAIQSPFENTKKNASGAKYPCGWLVIVEGPGRGEAFSLFSGVSTIGRSEDQTICLDFGDRSISRQNHAAVAYDPETLKFYLGHGGKSNIIRLNDRPVLSTEELRHGDQIRIGETKLRFVALCDEGFSWSNEGA